MKQVKHIRITSGKVEVSEMEKPVKDKSYILCDGKPFCCKGRRCDSLVADENLDKALEAFSNSFVEVSNPYEWLFTPPFHKKEDGLTDGLFNVEGKNWTFEVMEMDSADGTESEKLATISFQDHKPQENNHTYGYEGKNGYFGTQAGFNKIEPQEEPKELPDLEKQFESANPYSAWINSEIYPDGKIHTREYVNWLQQKIEALEDHILEVVKERDDILNEKVEDNKTLFQQIWKDARKYTKNIRNGKTYFYRSFETYFNKLTKQ